MIEVKLSFQTQAAMLAFFATTAAVSAPEKAAVVAIAAPKPAPAPAGSSAGTAKTPVAPCTDGSAIASTTNPPGEPGKPVAAETPAAATASSAKPDESAASGAVEYATVAAAITNMVKTDRARAVAVLGQFGVKKGTELKAEQFADFLKALG